MSMKVNWDALGITTSLACAIHCALLPLLVTSLPILGVNIVHNASFEYAMLVSALVIGMFALHHGYRRHHHQAGPLLVFAAGMVFLIAKQTWHDYQLWLLVPGVLGVVLAHYLNFRLCRKANACHKSDCKH